MTGVQTCALPILRGDLMEMGRTTCTEACEHMRTMRAVLNEMSHNPGLQAVMQEQFIRQRRRVFDAVLAAAVERREISASAINDEIFDLLPGYLVFRALISDRPPTDETVRIVVDNVLLPSLKAQSAVQLPSGSATRS